MQGMSWEASTRGWWQRRRERRRTGGDGVLQHVGVELGAAEALAEVCGREAVIGGRQEPGGRARRAQGGEQARQRGRRRRQRRQVHRRQAARPAHVRLAPEQALATPPAV